jgi:hypothetical protein
MNKTFYKIKKRQGVYRIVKSDDTFDEPVYIVQKRAFVLFIPYWRTLIGVYRSFNDALRWIEYENY